MQILGGQDFDNRIIEYVIDEFYKSSSSKYDIFKKPRTLKRLRQVCIQAKESLSNNINSYDVYVSMIYHTWEMFAYLQLEIDDDNEIRVALTREKLNELCIDLFEEAVRYVDRVLDMIKLTVDQIDHVVMNYDIYRKTCNRNPLPKMPDLLTTQLRLSWRLFYSIK